MRHHLVICSVSSLPMDQSGSISIGATSWRSVRGGSSPSESEESSKIRQMLWGLPVMARMASEGETKSASRGILHGSIKSISSCVHKDVGGMDLYIALIRSRLGGYKSSGSRSSPSAASSVSGSGSASPWSLTSSG